MTADRVSLIAWIVRHGASVEAVERPDEDCYAWHGYRVTIPEPYALAEADDLPTALLAASHCAGVEPPDVDYEEEW